MTASSVAVNVRGALKTALSGVTASVYDSVPEAGIPPFAAIVPGAPYFEVTNIGTSSIKFKVNLQVTAAVAYFDNSASLDNLEKLIISILTALPSGYILGAVDAPGTLDLGASKVLAANINLSMYYTQTN